MNKIIQLINDSKVVIGVVFVMITAKFGLFGFKLNDPTLIFVGVVFIVALLISIILRDNKIL